MKITVVILGRASDYTGVNRLDVELSEGSRLVDLIKAVSERTNRFYTRGILMGTTYS